MLFVYVFMLITIIFDRLGLVLTKTKMKYKKNPINIKLLMS